MLDQVGVCDGINAGPQASSLAHRPIATGLA